MTYSCGYLVAIQSTLSGRGPSTIFLFSLDSSDLINRTSGPGRQALAEWKCGRGKCVNPAAPF